MSSRSKEKVTAAIRKFFKSSSDSKKESKDKDSSSAVASETVETGNQQQQQQQQHQSHHQHHHLHQHHHHQQHQHLGGHHHHPHHHHTATTASNGAPGGSNGGSSSPSGAPIVCAGATGVTTGNGTTNPATQTTGNGNSKTNTDSPMRRLRCVVAPTSTPMVNVPASKPLDTTIRSRRLMKELKEIERLQHSRTEPCFTVELINDNLYEWHARLYRIDPDSPLAEDLVELNIPFILLHLVFPENFPFAPPFMRVVEPRIEKGFVMEGGAICMELLTPRGWASAYTVEAILMQFAASLVKGQGRVSRKPKSSKDFSRRSAEEAFRSLVKTHEKYGWVTPALNDG
ncbi:ubiquitin-conjugating enzyme E2Q-like protein CG4502 [Anopheles darlingi]|uniref:ubiquitin-conjugating enzyme E2Q-like protein CG4502 n=1 Tax=Anopheles darlingi TaxID=43151 RepID=UPI002100155A|nr:ubiquitin-conjugating enzyme E2Q-like protein CG4502 [Anopheles darlingi]